MRDLKFRALFKHLKSKETIWLETMPNHALKDMEGYVRLTAWMQYTGCKDKNGKEIYEGDIIETNNHCGKTHFLIQYENGYCGSLGSFVAIHLKSFDKNNASTSSVHCGVTENCEIIGNIHENHDLL